MEKKPKKEKIYMCMGENFVNGTRIGYCGKAYTLTKWLEILYPTKIQQVKEYFDGAGDKEIINYIYKYNGKRLEVVKEWKR